MFEYDREIVTSLLNNDDAFRRLYMKHEELKNQVDEINHGFTPADDKQLGFLKKEKLLLKDRMATIIADYRQSHA
ncbi:MAG: DUF465 domain-containing protein [Gammaproteobacteria bacterium]|jgi:uncharacterized protein YdcH (DUF465 family)|nr:MAG: DUF465 domain-containing protein [Gammaproteobacteria bacterium]